MQKLLEQLAATAELMNHQLSPVALSVMAKDLNIYPVDVVIEALKKLRNSQNRFTQAWIVVEIERLQPDGRPGADEAWAMIPRDEYSSAVMTEEMSVAMGIAQPLLNEGDHVAARMAFKEAYARIVDVNKRASIKPKWFPSLGMDQSGREQVLVEAVRLGRMSGEHATKLLPHIQLLEVSDDVKRLINKLKDNHA